MSEYHLSPGVYTITNVEWEEKLVSEGGNNDIIGNRMLLGGTQAWRLHYTHDGYATFQGVSASVPDREGPYITVDWEMGTLCCCTKVADASKFKLYKVNTEADNVLYVTYYRPGGGHEGFGNWFLTSGCDGTQVTLSKGNNKKAQWKFA